MANVNLEDLKPNSHTYREKEKESEQTFSEKALSPIVPKEAILATKKSTVKKIAEKFVSKNARDLKEFIIFDVLLPGIKDTVMDFLSMAFYGESISRDRNRHSNRGDGYYDYSSRSSTQRSRSSYNSRNCNYPSDNKVDFRNIILRDRISAERIINKMYWRIEDNGSASVADFLDLLGLISQSSYTDCNWGWGNTDQFRIKRTSNGFKIEVDEPRYLG